MDLSALDSNSLTEKLNEFEYDFKSWFNNFTPEYLDFQQTFIMIKEGIVRIGKTE